MLPSNGISEPRRPRRELRRPDNTRPEDGAAPKNGRGGWCKLRKTCDSMKLDDLIILLPCQSIEDFSLDIAARQAEEMLSAWSAMYHPTLVAMAESTMRWVSADCPPDEPAGSLVFIPEASEEMLPDGWLDKATAAGARILRGLFDREAIVRAALDGMDDIPAEVAPDELDQDLVGDFFALGFCHFQVELLTRQLRYMSNLDEDQFERETLAAAKAAIAGDGDTARDHLRSAFDLLTEAREYFYPVEAQLLDLTLVAPTTLGESLRKELAGSSTKNLLLSAEVVEQMAAREPATLAALKEALEKGTVEIIGGEYRERELPLLPLETIRAQLLRGLDVYEKHLGRRPNIFGRRRFGLTPVLPRLLKNLGFAGALHFTLDDGRFPSGNQSKITWEGVEGTSIEALARLPLETSRPTVFLTLPEKLGDVMDLDHMATAVFAHWPARSLPWYEDIKRMDAYSTVLGRFVTIGQYFEQSEHAGQAARYTVDQYRSPYLKQAVAGGQVDPLSRWVRYHGRQAVADASALLDALAQLAGSSSPSTTGATAGLSSSEKNKSREDTAGQASSGTQANDNDLVAAIEEAVQAEREGGVDLDGADLDGADLDGVDLDGADLDARLEAGLGEAVARCASSLGSQFDRSQTERKPGLGASPGVLVLNPLSFARTMHVDVSELKELPAVAGPVRFAAESAGRKQAVVSVPAMGFSWIGPGGASRVEEKPRPKPARRWGRKQKPKEPPPLAEENVLRNEFFEATFDPVTGAIRSIYDYHSRGNRLAQQVALRIPGSGRTEQGVFGSDDPEVDYSIMAADELTVTASGPVLGEIVCRGRLIDRSGRRVARFVQTTRSRRGSRVLELDLELDAEQAPGANPWDSYYAMRLAWNDATADVYRSANLLARHTDGVQLEAPQFVEVRSEKTRTTFLTGGLPYHRRFGLRKLDVLLAVRGETSRRFRLGIGIDLPDPANAALEWLAPDAIVSRASRPPSGDTGWLLHLSAKTVVVTHLEPVCRDDRVVGFRARLLETAGSRTRFPMRSFRAIASARKINPDSEEHAELIFDGDVIGLDMNQHEWLELEVLWVI